MCCKLVNTPNPLSVFFQVMFCFSGVVAGTIYGLRLPKKSMLPMALGGAVGSASDMVYGYTVACSKEAEAWRLAKESGR